MHRSALGLVLLGALGAACTVTSTSSPTPAADGGAPTPDGGAVDGDAGVLGFTPSNVDLSGIDLTKVGDFVVDGDECTILTDSSLASCGEGAGNILAFKIATQSDGTKVAVYVAKSMTIQAGANLTIQGALPLVFIALDTITIAGTLNGNSKGDVGIAGGFTQPTHRTKGAGAGGGGAGTAVAASGGGSYCGIGGTGGAESGLPTAGGVAYGSPEISPLAPGSSGGAADDSGGSGGGAIQLVAGKSITIAGVVQVGGGGGGFGGISGQEANGGGSGGSLLLESLAATVSGTLAANGAGGGAGTSADVGAAPPLDPGGANSTADAIAAAGGKATVGPSSGGNGSAAGVVNGTPGAFTAGNSAGGGGGGAGRIRINTQSGQATVTGVLSPSASTTCATQGRVK